MLAVDMILKENDLF